MKNIQDLGNGRGFIYVTDVDDNVLYNLPNNADGIMQARQMALIVSGLLGEVRAHAEITFTATPTGDVTAINVDGVNQIGGSVAMTNNDIPASVISMRDAVNSYTPGSGPNYTAHAIGDVLQLVVPSGFGKSANNKIVSVSAGTGINSTATRVYGGVDPTDIIDGTYGKKFYLDAGYGSGDVSGEGTATEGDISNAIDITEYLVMRGLQSKIDTPSATLANDTLTIERTMSIMYIDLDTESGAGTDDLKVIDAGNWVFGDLIVLKDVNASHVVTVHHTSGAGENIYLQDSGTFALGSKNRLIALQYINDNGTAKWVELWRTPAVTTVSVSSMRTAGIPQPVSGTHSRALATTGGSVLLVPGTDVGYQILTGSGTLSANWTIDYDSETGGAIDGDAFIIDYQGTFTPDGNNITIFGHVLTDSQVSGGHVLVKAVYSATLTAWEAYLFVDMSTAFVENALVRSDANINGSKIADGSIGSAKLNFTVPPVSTAAEIVVIPASFESGEQGAFNYPVPYNCNIDLVSYVVKKAIAGTDNASVTLQCTGGAIPESITITASSALGSTGSITPSSPKNMEADSNITVTTSKTTPGGKIDLIFKLTRT